MESWQAIMATCWCMRLHDMKVFEAIFTQYDCLQELLLKNGFIDFISGTVQRVFG